MLNAPPGLRQPRSSAIRILPCASIASSCLALPHTSLYGLGGPASPLAHPSALDKCAVHRHLRSLACAGYPEMTSMAYFASSTACIGAIACLSQQQTARVGNALGMIGVSGGIAATMGALGADAAVYTQIAGLLALLQAR